MAWGLLKVIEYRNEFLFWVYIGIGGISATTIRWVGNASNKSKSLKIVEYIVLTWAITLFLCVFWEHFFSKEN